MIRNCDLLPKEQITQTSFWEQDGVDRIDISLITGSNVACRHIKLTSLLWFKIFISSFIATWWLALLPHLSDMMTLKKTPREVLRTAHVIALCYNIYVGCMRSQISNAMHLELMNLFNDKPCFPAFILSIKLISREIRSREVDKHWSEACTNA